MPDAAPPLIPNDERRNYISFAKTILLHLPISVVIRAGDEQNFKPFMEEDGHIQLAQLMANREMATAPSDRVLLRGAD